MSAEVGHHVHRQLPTSVIKSGWSCMICQMHSRVHRMSHIGVSSRDSVGIKGYLLYTLDDHHGGAWVDVMTVA